MGFLRRNRHLLTIALILLASGALLFSAGRLVGKLNSLQVSSIELAERIRSLEDGIGSPAKSADMLYDKYAETHKTLESLNGALADTMKLLERNNVSGETDISGLIAYIDAISAEMERLNGSIVSLSDRINALKASQAEQPVVSLQESEDMLPAGKPGGVDASSGQPAENPSEPSPPVIAKGERVSVSIHADNIEDIYAYQFSLKYNKDELSYTGGPVSSIGEIPTIFAKDMGAHILVGATMIGAKPGYTGNGVLVCTLGFTSLKDCDAASLILSDISVVKSDQSYIEGVTNWGIEVLPASKRD